MNVLVNVYMYVFTDILDMVGIKYETTQDRVWITFKDGSYIRVSHFESPTNMWYVRDTGLVDYVSSQVVIQRVINRFKNIGQKE